MNNLNFDPSRIPSRAIFIASGLGLVGYGFLNSLFNVEGGHRAVIFNRFVGVKDHVYTEGTHFLLPWVEKPEIYSVRVKPRNVPSLTPSKDLQMVNITLRVLSKPDERYLTTIHKTLGHDYDERVLPSIANEVLKSVVAQFNASQLITQREQVSALIKMRLTKRAREFNIILDDVSITYLSFGKEYTAAVEAKQVAQQEAERAKFIVERAKQTKLEIIVRAEGEALAAKKFNEQLQYDSDGNFLELRRIEAAKEIAKTIATSQNRVFIDSANLMFALFSSLQGKSLVNDMHNMKRLGN